MRKKIRPRIKHDLSTIVFGRRYYLLIDFTNIFYANIIILQVYFKSLPILADNNIRDAPGKKPYFDIS